MKTLNKRIILIFSLILSILAINIGLAFDIGTESDEIISKKISDISIDYNTGFIIKAKIGKTSEDITNLQGLSARILPLNSKNSRASVTITDNSISNISITGSILGKSNNFIMRLCLKGNDGYFFSSTAINSSGSVIRNCSDVKLNIGQSFTINV
ncbi:MAG: hypothetical protein PHE25_03285, partial [Candidatus Gracilibacteria bacterium]|nr:hypothetical protein [Candidatus Gracilibacteria bacterium]